MGMFDDLVPAQGQQQSGVSGAFDDLLVKSQQLPQQQAEELEHLRQIAASYPQGSRERVLATQKVLRHINENNPLSAETKESPEQRLLQDALEGGALAVGVGRVGTLAKAAKSPVMQKIGTWLAQRALPAAAQGSTSALAGGMVREEGGSQGEQLAASMGTAVGAPLAARALAPVGRTAKNIFDYAVMPGGPRRAVGRVAVDAAGPRAGQIPGALRQGVSIETAAEAAAPVGSAEFSGLQRIAAKTDPSAFSPLGTIPTRQKEYTKQAWDYLGEMTAPMREEALTEANKRAGGAVDVTPILLSIDDILRQPGYDTSKTAQRVLGEYKTALIAGADPSRRMDAKSLYTIRKEMGKAIKGMVQKEDGDMKMTSGLVNGLQDEIDAVIQGAAGNGNWKQYLNAYSAGAQKINDLGMRQDTAKRLGVAGADAARKAFNADEVSVSVPNLLSRPIALTNALIQRAQGIGSARSSKELARLMTPEAKAELAQLMEQELAKRSAPLSLRESLMGNAVRGLLGYGASQ